MEQHNWRQAICICNEPQLDKISLGVCTFDAFFVKTQADSFDSIERLSNASIMQISYFEYS